MAQFTMAMIFCSVIIAMSQCIKVATVFHLFRRVHGRLRLLSKTQEFGR